MKPCYLFNHVTVDNDRLTIRTGGFWFWPKRMELQFRDFKEIKYNTMTKVGLDGVETESSLRFAHRDSVLKNRLVNVDSLVEAALPCKIALGPPFPFCLGISAHCREDDRQIPETGKRDRLASLPAPV